MVYGPFWTENGGCRFKPFWFESKNWYGLYRPEKKPIRVLKLGSGGGYCKTAYFGVMWSQQSLDDQPAELSQGSTPGDSTKSEFETASSKLR